VLQVLVFFHLVVSLILVGLVLMHSGRDTGMSGMGFVPASQGGTHIVEKNLTRLTVAVGVVFFVNTVLLYRMLA
jgi:preprotein translocase subunit SecG